MRGPVPRQILVVDDEVGLRELAKFLLEPLGHQVFTASNGAEAVLLSERLPFDLILLDVHMPVMGGHEALKRIKARRPEQKVVIISGSSDVGNDFERSAIGLGACDCVFKPLSLEELTSVVERHLPSRSAA